MTRIQNQTTSLTTEAAKMIAQDESSFVLARARALGSANEHDAQAAAADTTRASK
jgi:hypothetical protein